MNTFTQFYPSYLQAHSNRGNRILHFIGATLCLIIIALALQLMQPLLFGVAGFIGYFFPHIGHRRFEKNHSMRLSNPVFCVMGAFIMYLQHWVILITRFNFPEKLESPFKVE